MRFSLSQIFNNEIISFNYYISGYATIYFSEVAFERGIWPLILLRTDGTAKKCKIGSKVQKYFRKIDSQ